MNKKSILPLSIRAAMLSTALLISTQAFAFSMDTQNSLSLLDIDSDGTVTAEEMAALFNEADVDQSTTLSLEEFTAFKEAERLAKISHSFTRLDYDNDNFINTTELSNVFPSTQATDLMNQFGGEDSLLNSDEFTIMRLSEDFGDGEIAWEFAELDINTDGVIQYAEFVPDRQAPLSVKVAEQPIVEQPTTEPEADSANNEAPVIADANTEEPAAADGTTNEAPVVADVNNEEPQADNATNEAPEANETENLVAQLTQSTLEALTVRKAELETQLETATGRAATRIERRLNWLDTRIQRLQTVLNSLQAS
jgi:Ca2+-binding EF-hand superfamily protein